MRSSEEKGASIGEHKTESRNYANSKHRHSWHGGTPNTGAFGMGGSPNIGTPGMGGTPNPGAPDMGGTPNTETPGM